LVGPNQELNRAVVKDNAGRISGVRASEGKFLGAQTEYNMVFA